jgi:hypothetical protein
MEETGNCRNDRRRAEREDEIAEEAKKEDEEWQEDIKGKKEDIFRRK